ncbi:MAG TPA: phosphoribosylglycinamide formyltransferase [Candidatus Eisenbacteria bacterium]|uniref:Phosphoribosylglycinamide formyltransferase n=1 Tax=Eiseniibacteriota bacterium TaxID=2212470 RepID=A0A7V2AUK0_UNCEI|nr:phosphoribosylglycinamide formyltransferase [Candidatus Eisenbacteria bacterium]
MKDKMKIAVIASGRGSNFMALVKACRKDGFPAGIALLITDNPDAGALESARKNGIESFVVDCGPGRGSMSAESSSEMRRLCVERGVELVCLAGFMRIVRGDLLDAYGGRMLNIHPALLPSFKGLHGQKQALDYGVRYSGCTVHFVDPGVDTGPIIIQKVVPVMQDDTEESLSERILVEEHKAYPEAVRLYAGGKLKIEGRRVLISYE